MPIQETDSKTPTSPYGADKLTVDHYARLYNELYGVETVGLRYFSIFGARQRAGDYGGVISIFREQALAGGIADCTPQQWSNPQYWLYSD